MMKADNISSYPWPEVAGFIILMLLGVCLCSRLAKGQPALYLLFQPADLGVGPRIDYYPFSSEQAEKQTVGFYNSLTYGSCGLYKRYELKHHVKFTTGVLIPLKPYRKWNYSISGGANYHHLGKGVIRNPDLSSKIYRSWSYELGFVVKMQRLAVCVATDIPRWEPCIGIGSIF